MQCSVEEAEMWIWVTLRSQAPLAFRIQLQNALIFTWISRKLDCALQLQSYTAFSSGASKRPHNNWYESFHPSQRWRVRCLEARNDAAQQLWRGSEKRRVLWKLQEGIRETGRVFSVGSWLGHVHTLWKMHWCLPSAETAAAPLQLQCLLQTIRRTALLSSSKGKHCPPNTSHSSWSFRIGLQSSLHKAQNLSGGPWGILGLHWAVPALLVARLIFPYFRMISFDFSSLLLWIVK